MPEKQVALLRGINVGGNRLIPMKELAALFTELGMRDVVTYIQSGNVVYTPPKPIAPSKLEAAIEARFGFAVPLVVRSHGALKQAFEANPFLSRAADRAHLYLGFLSAAPGAKKTIDPARSPGDEAEVVGDLLYLHFPKGLGKTKLTSDYLDRALGVMCTVRNWNTVEKLVALSG